MALSSLNYMAKAAKLKIDSALYAQILELLKDGHSERSIFRLPQMPSWECWCDFKIYHITEEQLHQYARAKELGLISWEEKLREIARNEKRDLIPDGKGGFKSDNTAVNRDRLIIDTDKWLMSKMLPGLYGDKVESLQQITNNQSAITINVLSSSDLKKVANAISKPKQIEEKTSKD